MTDRQLIALAVTILAILAGTLFNVRIIDLNTSLSACITDLKEVLRADFRAETGEIRHLMERNHEALLAAVAGGESFRRERRSSGFDGSPAGSTPE